VAAATAALRRAGLIELGTRSLENSLTPRGSFQAQGRNTPSSVSLTRELNGVRSFAPSIRRLAQAQARTKALTVPLRHCASLPLYFSLKSPIAILIIRLMHQKSIVLENQQRLDPSEKENERIERHIYIVSS